MPFEVRDRVRWGDVDGARIIYFGAYVRLIELAETEFYREIGFPWQEIFERFDVWLPRVHLDIDFRAPARFDDPLQLLTWVRAVGTSSVRFEVVVRRPTDETLLARAKVVTVCVDRRTERSRPLPEAVATVLRRNVEAA